MKIDFPVGEVDFARHMMAVAQRLLGEPNKRLSTAKELRFGTRGSLCIDVDKGRWFDHEANTGGGVLDLIHRETGQSVAGGAAAIWLRENILGTVDATPVRPAGKKCEVATYHYEDEAGTHLFDVVRFEPKDFRQRAADGKWTVKSVRKVLYRLPRIVAAPEGAFVYVVEGEKDVHRLEAEGLIATTNPGGAGKWRDDYSASLTGKNVVIVPDNDNAGHDHADKVQASLSKAGIRCRVLCLEGLPEKGDISDWLDKGNTGDKLDALAARAMEMPEDAEPITGPGLGLVPFSADLAPLLEDAWLIEDVLPEDGLGVGYGAPGAGKTFQILDMAFAIAGASATWRGRYVTHGTVLYFGMEGGRAFQNRVAAYAREKSTAPHFFRSSLTLDLRATMTHAQAIVAEARKHADAGQPVKLIVVDTLSRAMAGGNENAPDDMGRFIAVCDFIRKEIGCYVLIVHHSGKDETRGARGHTTLLGAIDTELHFERQEDGCTMTLTKQRDGEDGLTFGYALRKVELGRSPRGKVITSCVVDEAEVDRKKKNPLGPVQKIALEALEQFAADYGVPNPDGTGWPEPGTKRCVDSDVFLAFLKDKMTSDNSDSRRRMAKRALNDLIAKGRVQTNGGMAWIV